MIFKILTTMGWDDSQNYVPKRGEFDGAESVV